MIAEPEFLPSVHNHLSSEGQMSELVAQLPNEIWIHILQEAVKLVSYRSETKAFFPPPDDFTLISGFKGACSSFRSLAEETERLFKGQNMCVSDSGEILRSKEEDLVRIRYVLRVILYPFGSSLTYGNIIAERHLAFKRKVTLADYLLFMPRCSKLESLYIYFAERSFGVLGPQTLLVSQSLVLLDLVYENMWWHAPTLALPNLRELRLSSQDPRRRLYEPVCVPLDSTSAERFAVRLQASKFVGKYSVDFVINTGRFGSHRPASPKAKNPLCAYLSRHAPFRCCLHEIGSQSTFCPI